MDSLFHCSNNICTRSTEMDVDTTCPSITTALLPSLCSHSIKQESQLPQR